MRASFGSCGCSADVLPALFFSLESLPPESAITSTITTEIPPMNQACALLGSRPGGGVAFFCTVGTFWKSVMALLVAREAEFLFADGQVPFIQDLVHDVNGVLVSEVHKIGLAVFDFVERGCLLGPRLNVGELVVAVHCAHEEGFFAGLKAIGEPDV